MPGHEGLRMTAQRVIEMQEQLNTCINSLNDLEIYNDMGADDSEMCGMMRNALGKIANLWTDIQREFCQALATLVDQVDKLIRRIIGGLVAFGHLEGPSGPP